MRPAQFEFNTGRTYDKPQVLKCEYLGAEPADFLGYRKAEYKVVDESRRMSFKVTIAVHSTLDSLADIQSEILTAYDQGDYR